MEPPLKRSNFIQIYLSSTSQQIATITRLEIQQNMNEHSLSQYVSLTHPLTHSRHIIFLVIVYYFYAHGKINNVR